MRSVLIALFLAAFFSPLLAQDIEAELEADLKAIEFGTIDEMAREFKTPVREVRLKKSRWYRETPWGPPPFRAVIRKGTILETMDGEKKYLLPRDITAWVKLPYTSSIYTSILDKEAKPRLRIRSEKVVDIERTVRLTPEIDPYKTYVEKPLFAATDKELKLKTIFSLNTHNGDAAFYANLFGGESSGFKANNIALKTFYAGDFPIEFGLSLMVESGSWGNQQEGLPVEWQSVSLGPAIRMELMRGETFVWNAELSVLKDLSSTVTLGDEGQIDLSTTTFELQAEMALPTRYGTFAFAVGYNRQEAAAKDGPSNILYYSSDTGTNQSTFFGINYQFGWQL